MFKKIVSLTLVLMLVLGMAAIAASAAQVEISENAADTPAAVGAEGAADTGAESGAETGASGNSIYFDPTSAGWNNFKYVSFHIWAIDDDSFSGYEWGGKKQRGKDNGDGKWVYDLDAAGLTIQDGKQYCVIFYNDLGMQTYNLLFGTPCIGQTAACDGTVYENPEDSNKTATAAFWGGGIDASVYGPELKISSIGTVVGTCCAASTSPYAMFVDFLTNTLNNARTFSGKDDQTLLDDTASKLNLYVDNVKGAIAEAGVTVDWDPEKSNLPKGENKEVETTPAGDTTPIGGGDPEKEDSTNSDGGSNNGGSNNGSSNNGSSNNGGGSSSGGGSSASGSGSGSKTGQETTVLYIMLGVMVAAAGVIFFARKKNRA